MSREPLTDAADELDAARDQTADPAVCDRLETLAGCLRSQADREATPALGTLDRVQVKLREIEDQTDDTTVVAAVDSACEQILSFLGTLDDRAMTQHGRTGDEEEAG